MLLGIDLGTTYSAISYLDENGNPQIIKNRDGDTTTPSVVFVDGDQVMVGKKARFRGFQFPKKLCKFVKCIMGFKENALPKSGDNYSPESISALLVRRLLEDVLIQHEEEITGIVVTVPTFFTDARRTATKQAVEGAIEALKQDKEKAAYVSNVAFVKMIDEPKAAALYYTHKAERESGKVLIYDLGGGTFDAALVEVSGKEITVIGEEQESEAGGIYFDDKIRDYIVGEVQRQYGINLKEDKYAGEYEKLLLDAELCKIKLSEDDIDEVYMTINIGFRSVDVLLTREKLEELIETIVQRSMYAVGDLLENKDLEPDDVDEVVLVGGSSRIPYVRKTLAAIFPSKPTEAVDPDKAVCYGAALYAGMLNRDIAVRNEATEVHKEQNGRKVELQLQDICTHPIGILLTDVDTRKKYNDILIEANTPLIAEGKREYEIAFHNQTYINIELTEDEMKLEDVEIKLPQALPIGTRVEIHVKVNYDHLIEVSMTIPSIEFMREKKLARLMNLSEEEQRTLSGLVASKCIE